MTDIEQLTAENKELQAKEKRLAAALQWAEMCLGMSIGDGYRGSDIEVVLRILLSEYSYTDLEIVIGTELYQILNIN